MRGIPSLDALCEAVRQQGGDTVALTDTNGLYGAIRFIEVARRAGLRPILGAELVHAAHRAVLLAKTMEGYQNLCRLLSARHCDAAFDCVDAVAKYRSGLCILSDDAPALAAWHRDSPEDLYVEVTPGPRLQEAIAFSRRSGLPPVATTQAHFLSPDHYSLHRLLRAIALNTTLSRLPPHACCAPSCWLMNEAVMARHLPQVPEALTNARDVAEQCRTGWDFRDTIFPSFRRLRADQAYELLSDKTYRGAVWRYGTLTPEIKSRIERELGIIRAKGFAHYFLVVNEIVRRAPKTCGRGSVAASIVSYCLGLTHVDPIRHHLFFDRFLNEGRHDPPDIDIDFPWDERDAILQEVFNEYGHDSAAMVANQNMLAIRASIREVAKVFGMPPEEIRRGMASIFRQADLVRSDSCLHVRHWAEAVCRTLGLRPPWSEILHAAVQLEDHFRNLGLHCGGIVLVPEEIRRYVPVEISAKGLPVIQWDKDQTEDAGLVKIDLLGNRSLAVIRDALAAIANNTGRHIDYATWEPLDDAATKSLICQGDTLGCFYIESPATRLLLRKLWTGMPDAQRAKADVFEYLVMVSSLVRPATNPFIIEFLKRAHGKSYQPLHERLKGILDETHGIMTYQEDVTKVAMALADFSIEDGDQLRKVLSKKHKAKQLQEYREQFRLGAKKNGAGDDVIDVLWGMIMSFAGYSFCKPHSASYAQVSFKSAYLRAHYPAEFMAAVINNQGGFYSTQAYVSEARRMGLAILLPDVNVSGWYYAGEGRAIRVGLMQLKTIRRELIGQLVDARTRDGPFRSLQDFLERLRPIPAQVRTLIKAGCFDSIAGELTRPALLWRLLAWTGRNTQSYVPIPPEYSRRQQIRHEIDIVGFPVSCHPLDLFQAEIRRIPHVPARDIPRHVGKTVTLLGWLVTEKMVHTKHDEAMEFVTFEDTTGLFDATVFPDAYRQYCHLLEAGQGYVIRGLVEESFSTCTVTVDTLARLTEQDSSPTVDG
jgi:error-prone DNA polymerase